MTVSAEPPALEPEAGAALDASWRVEAARAQEQAMPAGRVVVSSPAPFGAGGLGRHLQEIAAALERRGTPPAVISEDAARSTWPARGRRRPGELAALAEPLARFSPAWRIWSASVAFDARAARRLPEGEHLIAFNGTALAQFSAASSRFQSIALMSANSHFRLVMRQHERAHSQYPLERPWPRLLLARNLREYARADRIYVSSEYIRASFIDQGVREETISLFPLTPDPRYTPRVREPAGDDFEIVYVGSLTVHKGVPLLLDAVRRLDFPDLRLTLVGGWKTRAMRRLIERACAADDRISVRPGDPLPRFARARLCVHPAYEDGFAYAPAEALACGVPVIVSEDTGMKELIGSPGAGLVVPTGDLGALTDAIAVAYRGEILDG